MLTQSRDSQKLKAEIVAMREKMRAEKKDRGDMLDLKHTLGGMVDVEFIVQYIILAHAHDHAEFLGNLGNFALLDRAGALGLLDPTLAHRVGDAYLRFREQQHLARTHNQAITLVPPTTLSAERAAVGAAWQALLGH